MYSFCSTFDELSGFILPWQLEDEQDPGPMTIGVADDKEAPRIVISATVKRRLIKVMVGVHFTPRRGRISCCDKIGHSRRE